MTYRLHAYDAVTPPQDREPFPATFDGWMDAFHESGHLARELKAPGRRIVGIAGYVVVDEAAGIVGAFLFTDDARPVGQTTGA